MDDQKSKNNKNNFKQKPYRQNDSKNNNGNNNRSDGKFHRDNSQRGGKFDSKDRGQFSSSPQRSFSKYDQSKDVEEFPKRTQSPKKRFSSSSFLDPIEHDDFAEHELTKRRSKNRYENKKKKRNRYDDDFDDFGWN